MPNHLVDEQSPYLLQHQDNPVDWYPWGEAAFAKARAEQKPIFLSIGYSTCHWCHVMAHESFEDAAIAEALNRDFVAVKVDREERPDVDRVYMTFVQATTGSGGWPMSVWLTPALEPFFGGTYFPPTSRWGRPGLLDVLTEIARAWREERSRVVASASQLVERLRQIGGVAPGQTVPGVEVLATAVQDFVAVFDAGRGGFGAAPKFPRPSELLFLMREHARTGAPAPAAMALRTLQAMAEGGLRDHIGGGFHRYSVDAEWRVPHFEKMLYDQAQLTLAYLEAATLTGEPSYAEVAADTLAYVARELTHPEGGFYSAEDADSLSAGDDSGEAAHSREGAYYLWTHKEWTAVLGDDAGVAAARFGVEPEGNAPADPQGEFAGQNVLYLARSLDEVGAATGRAPAEAELALTRAMRALRQHRLTRPRPHLDDKVLTAWNGLMIAAAARAARMFADSAWCLDMAVRAAGFLRSRMWDVSTATLYRRFRGGDVAVEAYAEDYAYLVYGLLELFQATSDAAWLSWALELQRRQDDLFWDEEGGGWFSTTGRDPSVLLRLKEDYDGAEPAATSVGAFNLLTLVHLTADPVWTERLAAALRVFGSRAGSHTRTVPMALAALSTYHAGPAQVVIAGEPGEPVYEAMLDVMRTSYVPAAVVVAVPTSRRDALDAVLPWLAALRPVDGGARAYVCRDFVCQMPCEDADALAEQLGQIGGVPR